MTKTAGWVIGGRYRVTDRLGSSGGADVFRAHDELLGRDVAVKVFSAPDRGPDRAGAAEPRSPELGALAALSHPNLVRLFDASLDERPPYLVMELVEGPSLADRLEDGPLPEARVRTIGAQLADALAYIHAHGMVHLDVKPANVLIGSDALFGDRGTRARLSDFGIGPVAAQADGAPAGPPADVHSLGLVLLEPLTGAARGPVPAHLPQPWPALLTAMTADDPAARPTADEVARALHEAAVTDAPTALIAAPPLRGVADADEPEEPQRRRRAWGLVAVAALASGLIGVAGYF
ncbi:MAG TPA: serine/threonine-protein kinase, partial [Gaiellaceae bacterium]|nr:serine/threonine-protein kinase [Gaiellaceae bacterium]